MTNVGPATADARVAINVVKSYCTTRIPQRTSNLAAMGHIANVAGTHFRIILAATTSDATTEDGRLAAQREAGIALALGDDVRARDVNRAFIANAGNPDLNQNRVVDVGLDTNVKARGADGDRAEAFAGEQGICERQVDRSAGEEVWASPQLGYSDAVKDRCAGVCHHYVPGDIGGDHIAMRGQGLRW